MPIDDYKDRYIIYPDGKVYSIRSRRFLNPYKTKSGYMRVALYKKYKHKKIFVHQLVGITFIPNPNKYRDINHKDFNKVNNNYTNLEWCTPEQNMAHYWSSGHVQKYLGRSTKKVDQLTLGGKFIRQWPSLISIQNTLGIRTPNICNCVKGRLDKIGGYRWRYSSIKS